MAFTTLSTHRGFLEDASRCTDAPVAATTPHLTHWGWESQEIFEPSVLPPACRDAMNRDPSMAWSGMDAGGG
jgi:hypothetical protein